MVSESLAVVGLIVPGAILMVIFGALIASGYLEFMPVFAAAVLGAIAGDGLSFWLGTYYQQQLKSIWPLKRYPDLIQKGEAFFNKHGGKSILLGRFIGPIRPIIPAIAGMMKMPTRQFLVINIFSALLWAPLYLLPGILLGASFELASQLAGRFALLLLVFIAFLWFSYQFFMFLYKKITPHTDQYIFSIMNWNTRHPFLANITGSLIDPSQKEIRGLSVLTLLLLLCSFISAVLITYAMQTGAVQNLNLLVFHLVESIQSPPVDWLLQWLSNLGDRKFLLGVIVVMAFWFALHKQWIAVAYLVAAYLVPLSILFILKWVLSLPSPPALTLYDSFNLPSGHTALSISVYGFTAVLLAQRFSEKLRVTIYIGIAWLVGSIGFTRLYFSTHWLTDIIAGFTLGLAWLSLLAIAYRRHHKQDHVAINKPGVITAFIILLLFSFPYQLSPRQISKEFEQYYVIPHQAWLDTGWQTLDQNRNDLQNKNRHPFTIQWSADAAQIEAYLEKAGWKKANNQLSSYFQWFNPMASVEKLPVLAHIHNGYYDNLRFYRLSANKKQLMVIRLWETDILIQKQTGKKSLWMGNVSYLEIKDLFLMRYFYTADDFNAPLSEFITVTKEITQVIKIRDTKENKNWDSKVLLLTIQD